MSFLAGKRDADGASGLFLAAPGVNVNTTTDRTQLLFDTTAPGYGTILAMGFVRVSNAVVTIGFPAIGFIPMAYCFLVGDSYNCRTRRYWTRPATATDASNWGMTDSGTFYSGYESLVEPYYRINSSQIIFDPTPYQNASGQKAGLYNVRYIIWKFPGSG